MVYNKKKSWNTSKNFVQPQDELGYYQIEKSWKNLRTTSTSIGLGHRQGILYTGTVKFYKLQTEFHIQHLTS